MEKQIFNFIQKNVLIIALSAAVIMIAAPLANASAAENINHNNPQKSTGHVFNITDLTNSLKPGFQLHSSGINLSNNWRQFLGKIKKHHIKKDK